MWINGHTCQICMRIVIFAVVLPRWIDLSIVTQLNYSQYFVIIAIIITIILLLINDSKTIVNHTKFIINGWDKPYKPCPGRQGYWQQKKLRLAGSLVFWSRLHGCSNQFHHGLMILMTGRFGGAPILRKPPCVVFCLFWNPWGNPTLPLPNTTNLLDEIWISHGRVAILPGLNPSNLHFLFAKPHGF